MKKNKPLASLKEISLLIVLFVLIAFYLINKVPLENWRKDLEAERENIQLQVDIIQPKIEQMDAWQKELDAVYAKYGNNPKSIPEYNNINTIIAEMSVIFDGDSQYSITFAEPKLNDHIVSRDIRITFSCYKYEEMIAKLVDINESNNRYRITDLSIGQDTSDLYSVSLSLIAYEYTAAEEL